MALKNTWATGDSFAASDENNVATAINQIESGQTAFVATSQTTASTTYADLATVTDTVTVTIGASGVALVCISVNLTSNAASQQANMSFAVSGANTIAAADDKSIAVGGAAAMNFNGGATYLLTGLTAGSTTFKAKYKSLNGGTVTFLNRRIAVIPLG